MCVSVACVCGVCVCVGGCCMMQICLSHPAILYTSLAMTEAVNNISVYRNTSCRMSPWQPHMEMLQPSWELQRSILP